MNNQLQTITRPFLKYVKVIFALVILCGFSNREAQAQFEWTPENFQATIDECTGEVTIDIFLAQDLGILGGTYWNYFNVVTGDDSGILMQEGGGTPVYILKFGASQNQDSNFLVASNFAGRWNHVFAQPNLPTVLAYDTYTTSPPASKHWFQITFALPPAMAGEQITFSPVGSHTAGGNLCCPIDLDWPDTPTLSTINASNATICDAVEISWSVPPGLCPNAIAEIQRDNSTVATTNPFNENFFDTGAAEGVEHDYRVRFISNGNGVNPNPGGYSNVATGTRRTPPAAPGNLQASTNDCFGSVALTWNFISGIDSIQIRRSGVNLPSISGNTANFMDEVPERGVEYEYEIRAKNNCGWGPFSADLIIGISPADPEKSPNLTATVIPGVGVQLDWIDVVSESTYRVERNLLGGGGSSFFDVPANQTSYTDESILACQTYQYRILSINNCQPLGVASDSVRQAILIPDLSASFDSQSFTGSKGFFADRIELNWNVNINQGLLSGFRIFRKLLGSDQDSTLIASTSSGSNLYIDNLADAGVLYEYTIIGESQCENSTIYTNTVQTVGFRRPFGTVTGNVTYSGGIAVEDVRITAASTSQILGGSISFDGSASAEIAHKSSLNPGSSFLAEAWLKPQDLGVDFTLFEKGSSYQLAYDASNETFNGEIQYNGGLSASISADADGLGVDNYQHLAFQLLDDSLQIFLNGNLLASQFVTSGVMIDANTDPILLGTGFDGNIDEVRIWNTGKEVDLIQRDFSRLLIGVEPGLRVYLQFNEGFADFAYDISRTGAAFNRNHAELSGGYGWSTEIPSSALLSLSAYTDAAGNYILNLPYNGLGENFVLTPSFLTHQFNPGTRALFVGNGQTIHNNIDFLDISSFTVSGSVFYANTSCPAGGINLSVDGNQVIEAGLPVQTDDAGLFEIQVPIGSHFIQVSLPGHTFSVGRFPQSGTFDFQDDLAGVDFEDSTLVKVVGRVVGGLREANKIPGLGLSKNNLGTAQVEFVSQLGNGCAGDTILTDVNTGEYVAFLPPLKYVPSVGIVNDPTVDFGTLPLLDLSPTPIEFAAYDTTFATDGTVSAVDSVSYNKRLDFIYRLDPVIVVKDRDGVNDFIGDTIYTYVNPDTQDTIVRNLRNDPFQWPIFTEKDDDYVYRALIKVFERYVNADNTALIDSVPVTDGTLQVINEMASITEDAMNLADVNTPDSLRFLVYSFQPDKPNFLANASIPDYSYTRRIEINVVSGSGNAVSWDPIPITEVPTGGDQKFRGIFLGAKTDGDQFITTGPEIPEYVLRDPPGSGSSASREIGSVVKSESSWNWTLGSTAKTEDKVYVGSRFNVGIGVSTATEIANNVIAGFEAEIGGGIEGTQSVTTTNTQSWSTNDGEDLPGSGSDLYIGKAQNVQFGIAEYLAVIPSEFCDDVECLGEAAPGFSFARNFGLSIVPGGYQTTFIYDQNFIVNYQIPNLTNLRNVLLQSNPKYTSNLSLTDPNYGLNNDNPVFGEDVSTETPTQAEFADLSGISYSYQAVDLNDSLVGDSVRFINNQIRHWEEAVRMNEWEKVNISNPAVRDSLRTQELNALEDQYEDVLIAYYALIAVNGVGGGVVAYGLIASPVPGVTAVAGTVTFAVTSASGIALAELAEEFEAYELAKEQINAKYDAAESVNYSISGGNSFTSTMTHAKASSVTNSIEYAMSSELKLEVEGKVNNNGVGFEKSIEMKFESGRDWTTETEESESVEFTLNDPDQGDFFSVDVYPSLLGWGPIFKKQAGGQTSCPHEDEELSLYYEPGTVLSEATLQVDKPTIGASPSILFNVPVNEPAVFNLTLGNESESNAGRDYTVALISTSNPFGAIARIDGQANITLPIPGGTAVNKVLSIEKGPGPVYEYDSLLFVIYAPCQFSGGTSDGVDIVDSVYVSARFIPTCTEVELVVPEESWVANTFNNDTIGTAIAGYNINFFDLESLNLDYKPSNESQWVGLQTFYRDTTGLNDDDAIPIPTSQSFTLYDWAVNELTDGYYDLRVRSQCTLAENTSVTYSGILDRLRPHVFGTPSPADGILSPNDDISIKFNETVDFGALSIQNFDIRGVLNGTTTAHNTSLFFDGIDDFINVSGGAALTNRDFTLQLAVRRAGTDAETILSQGQNAQEELYLGFNDAGQLVFAINGQEVVSTTTFNNTDWHYIGLSYSFENETADMYLANETVSTTINVGDNAVFANFVGGGRLMIGRRDQGDPSYFHGNIHELRIWDRALNFGEFTQSMNKILSGSEAGLLYNWRMDEAEGILAIDHVRRRDGIIDGAEWSVEPGGNAASFDGLSDYLSVSTGDVVITEDMNFTFELWFRGDGTAPGALFSNGSASTEIADSLYSWVLEKDANGLLHFIHNGNDFLISDQNFFDGSWHHLAVVMRRGANLTAIVDGNPEGSTSASAYREFSGPAMHVGAHLYQGAGGAVIEDFFQGEIDEFRFWSTDRKLEQIRRDKRNRMNGDEPALLVYLAFENYELDPTGIPILTPSFDEQINTGLHAVTVEGVQLTEETPTIKLQRPVLQIAFTYAVNNDEIIFTPTSAPASMENVTLDVTVSNVQDLQGNVMEAPVTWIAFMDKNQVVWADDAFMLEKEAGEELSFTTAILNQGGESKSFSIQNLPDWLSVNPQSGTVAANTSLPVDFTISEGVNIGDYIQDVQLLTDFNFPEKLTLDLEVREPLPDWEFDPTAYQFSMGIIGYLEIKDIVSTDPEDILVAFVDGEVRGIQNLEYVESIDRYLVFLDVYSSNIAGDQIEFKIWDASAGITFSTVSPEDIVFENNQLIGTTLDPQLFQTNYEVETTLAFDAGWNWLGYYLLNNDSSNFDLLFENLDSQIGDVVKGQTQFAGYAGVISWIGPLENSGIRPERLYKFYSKEADTLIIRGDLIDPTTRAIDLVTGWNWVGFISARNQGISQALGNLNPSEGDQIKGRSQFAIYTNSDLGWQGSLQTLRPGRGYMYKSAQNVSFTFPFAGFFKQNDQDGEEFQHPIWEVDYAVHPSNMNLIISPVDSCDYGLQTDQLMIGAFDSEGTIRGLSPLVGDKNQRSYLTVNGAEEMQLSLHYIDVESGEKYSSSGRIDFESNALKGSLETPFELNLPTEFCERDLRSASDGFAAYPTVFDEDITVTYEAGILEKEATIVLYDMSGRPLWQSKQGLQKGTNSFVFNLEVAHLSAGSYSLVLRTSKGIYTEKLIKIN